ncbi:hypothetical protein HPB50_009517 [Hyalomma asiaticum]|uniref:Uncharacterized protein n=1 Tax=Hyalomma asiaticum TaxID=266040 RepID=A0ACB7RIE0_HYAAI|nr:hypothetical protein HPB50_009517 [Hyalomma asiaticum]
MTTRWEYMLTGFGAYFERRRFAFPEPMPTTQVCSVCRFVSSITLVLPCGHVFCPLCQHLSAEGADERGASHQCPIDHSKFPVSSLMESTFTKDELEKRQFRCGIGGSKCDFVGTLVELKFHMKECVFDEVRCVKCRCVVVRSRVVDHYGRCAGVPSSKAQGPATDETSSRAVEELDAIKQDVEELRQELAAQPEARHRSMRGLPSGHV